MRDVYIADSTSSFWKSVDSNLAEIIREKAGTGDNRNKCIAKWIPDVPLPSHQPPLDPAYINFRIIMEPSPLAAVYKK